jgi:NTE family protein
MSGLFSRGPRRLGIALGGGSARGLAHIGVLKVLADAGLRPAAITGTSMGAIVGAFAAAGYSIAEIEQIAVELDVRDMVSFADLHPGRAAFVNGEKVEAWLREWLPPTFEKLVLPFACVSVDLRTGTVVRHADGDLIEAVRASCSIPGVFPPVLRDDEVLVDGGVLEPLPVPTLKAMRASDVAVAVTVSQLGALRPGFGFGDRERSGVQRLWGSLMDTDQKDREPRQFQTMNISLQVMQRELERPATRMADVVISPDVAEFDGHEFLEAPRLIALGELAAVDALPEIERRMGTSRG